MTHDEKIVEAVALVLEPKCRGFCGGSNGLSMGCAREFARAAITAFQAEAWQTEVKPLEWRSFGVCWTASAGTLGVYVIMPTNSSFELRRSGVAIGQYASEDEAMGSAQLNYQFRVLEHFPAPKATP